MNFEMIRFIKLILKGDIRKMNRSLMFTLFAQGFMFSGHTADK